MKIFRLPITLCFLGVFSILAQGCHGQNKVKTEEQRKRELILKNNIKKINEYQTSVLLGIKQEERLSETKLFNEKGYLERDLTFNSEGQIDLIVTYTYDANENLILQKAVKKDSSLMFRETTSYDSNNNRKDHYHYLADGTFKYRNVAFYDGKNRMTELSWYWPSGFRSKNVYTYNGDSKISDIEYSETGEKTYEWKYRYDSNYNLIEAIQYYPLNNLAQKEIYDYDAQNQLIKQTTFQNGSLSKVLTFSYDSGNLLISKTELNSSGKISSISRYSYE
jgi:hypothetical protein